LYYEVHKIVLRAFARADYAGATSRRKVSKSLESEAPRAVEEPVE
jgi:hypothetical protein